jgi:hypothetical protein
MFTVILILFSILLSLNIFGLWLEKKANEAERDAEEFFRTTMIKTQAKIEVLEEILESKVDGDDLADGFIQIISNLIHPEVLKETQEKLMKIENPTTEEVFKAVQNAIEESV